MIGALASSLAGLGSMFILSLTSLKREKYRARTYPAVDLELLHEDWFLLWHSLPSAHRRRKSSLSHREVVIARSRKQGLHVGRGRQGGKK